jgi:hypothetical protein
MNKSKILDSRFFIFLFGIIIIISLYENNSAYSQRVLQTYENEKYGIEMSYPPNWETIEPNIADETGELVVSFYPTGKQSPHIGVIVSFLTPENASLKTYTKENLEIINDFVAELEGKITILDQNSTVTLGGLPAHKVIYEDTYEDTFIDISGVSQTSKYLKIWTVLETEAYQLTFSSNDKEQYDQYIKTAEKIINSFEFTR